MVTHPIPTMCHLIKSMNELIKKRIDQSLYSALICCFFILSCPSKVLSQDDQTADWHLTLHSKQSVIPVAESLTLQAELRYSGAVAFKGSEPKIFNGQSFLLVKRNSGEEASLYSVWVQYPAACCGFAV